MSTDVIRVVAIGWRARGIVGDGGRPARVIAALSRSVYLDVFGDMIWLGPADSTLHGRAVLATDVPVFDEGPIVEPLRLDLTGARVWFPVPHPVTPDPATPAGVEALRERCRQLLAALGSLGVAEGFGLLLAGRSPTFPLHRAGSSAEALVCACAADDAAEAAEIAEGLLGLGPGLTPAGDDFVGGAFFARATLTAGAAGAWRDAAVRIRAQADRRTHRISATLLSDLLEGAGYAPLHDLATALVTATPPAEILHAARRLVRIGHSSGWDMLAGFIGTCLGGFAHDATP